MTAEIAMRRFKSRSGLFVERDGVGQPVILLHGWCLSRLLWQYEAEMLVSDFDVIVPDQAGFGLSDYLAGPYDLDRYTTDLIDLIDELQLVNPIVVGFAFGAAVAMAASTRSTALGGVISIGVPSAAQAPYERMPAAMRRDWPEFARRSAETICKGEHSAATLAWLASMFESTPLSVAIETVGLLGGFEPAEFASKLQAPTLFVHGELDDVVKPSLSEECARLAPEGQLALIPGSGHLVLLDKREDLHDQILGFISETSQ